MILFGRDIFPRNVVHAMLRRKHRAIPSFNVYDWKFRLIGRCIVYILLPCFELFHAIFSSFNIPNPFHIHKRSVSRTDFYANRCTRYLVCLSIILHRMNDVALQDIFGEARHESSTTLSGNICTYFVL